MDRWMDGHILGNKTFLNDVVEVRLVSVEDRLASVEVSLASYRAVVWKFDMLLCTSSVLWIRFIFFQSPSSSDKKSANSAFCFFEFVFKKHLDVLYPEKKRSPSCPFPSPSTEIPHMWRLLTSPLTKPDLIKAKLRSPGLLRSAVRAHWCLSDGHQWLSCSCSHYQSVSDNAVWNVECYFPSNQTKFFRTACSARSKKR